MAKVWTIGTKPDCDLVVNLPRVSGHHCRLTHDDDGYVLEDLGSTNGTYVNGVRVTGTIRVTQHDAVTLGLLTPMPWPSSVAIVENPAIPTATVPPQVDPTSLPSLSFKGQEMVIGRAPASDLLLDLPMVSSRHARLFQVDGQIWIEDLGSANGTFVNAQRINGITSVTSRDLISLGSYTLVLTVETQETAQTILEAPPVAADPSPTFSVATSAERSPGPMTTVPPARRLAALLAQAPVAAVFIVMMMKSNTAIVPTLYWMVLAALWFGLSDAVLSGLFDARRLREALLPDGARSLGLRLLVLASLCLWQCGLTWVLVAKVAALKGPALPAIAILLLASAVGAAIGLLIVSMAVRSATAWVTLAVVMLPLWLLGGGGKESTDSMVGINTVSNALPTRWAFEGLLLLEGEADQSRDLAEEYFPARSDRMGSRADVMALALMVVGLMAMAGFISHERGRSS